MTESKSVFSKHDTAAVKGVAVCMLLIHHLYMGVLPAPIRLSEHSIFEIIATLSKACVAIFALLSGYGITKSYEHSKEKLSPIAFQKKHLLSLLKPYWLVYVVFFVLSAFFARPEFSIAVCYGSGVRGFVSALLEFFALRPLFESGTLNQTWWYMEAALMMYLLFPFFRFLSEKLPYLILSLTAIPLILYTVFGNNVWNTCREIYCFFPFCVGIFAAQRGLLDRFSAWSDKHKLKSVVITVVALFVFALIRTQIGLAFDTFFALSILLFMRACFCRLPLFGKTFAFLGKYSADIFYTHSFFYCYFVSQYFFCRAFLWSEEPLRLFAAFPTLLAMSLAAGIVLEKLRTLLGRLFAA